MQYDVNCLSLFVIKMSQSFFAVQPDHYQQLGADFMEEGWKGGSQHRKSCVLIEVSTGKAVY